MQSPSLSDVLAAFGAMRPEEKDAVIAEAMKDNGHMKWIPSSGPQMEAYHSPADILLYGGQGGGGKSDLGLGLAFTAQKRSLILRRQYSNLSALTERAVDINGSRQGYNGSPPPLLRTDDGRYIQFGANQHAGDEQNWQGHAFDYKYLDEACQFLESQVRFHFGWLRSAEPGQRVRAVLGSNPPLDATGDWMIKMFRPWLDLTHPNPAQAGELRWFVTAPDGSDLEVESDRPIEIDGKKLIPKSRTFIPAALRDNPYLINTGYQAQLDALPEPLRSAVRDGNFMAVRKDSEFQVIPTDWIVAAQGRWKPGGWQGHHMTAMGFDPCGGGKDKAAIAFRHHGWYGPVAIEQGAPGDTAVGLATLMQLRRDQAPIVVDVGGGYASGAKTRFNDNEISHLDFNGAGSSTAKALASGLPMANLRAEAWWRFREALDPSQEGGSPIALPPDPELRSDLATPMMLARALEARGEIQIESKEDIRKRLGRSPDKGDAVVMCWAFGHKAVARKERGGRGSRSLPSISANPNRNPRAAKRHAAMISSSRGEQG
jgi:Terminase large subunit, T4likevirus-type, N-terminal